jgi:imidazolonepropionase-like amidohydrolase|tara:strand:- start:465 stop:1718 length:1254 start_codon:yes stop_codon:yes gene_type:complete
MLLKNANIYDVRAGTFRLGHLFVENGRIADIGFDGSPQSDAVDMEASYVLPGFVDCHVHLCVDTYNPDASRLWAGAKPGTIALSAARAAYRTLLCGVTSIREVGGWDYHEIAVRDAVNAGTIAGPRIFCAGKIISMTSSSTPYWTGMYEEADGPDEVRKAARKQLANGADLIKILASGAMTSSRNERADAVQLRPDEIKAAVEIAKDNFTHVASHAHACEAIINSVDCGCASVEHGSFGDETAYKMMAKAGTYLVPTLCVHPGLLDNEEFASQTPAHIRERYASLRVMRTENMRLAHSLGVAIAMGTDVGTPGNHAGNNLLELSLMVKNVGLSPEESLLATTLHGADLLGRADDFGSLEVGKRADLVAMRANPLQKIEAVDALDFVMKDGVAYRDDDRRLGANCPDFWAPGQAGGFY